MNTPRTPPPERLAARRARGNRAVRAVGYWTPELLAAATTAGLGAWSSPWWWLATGALLARIPGRPLARQWRATRTRRTTAQPRRLQPGTAPETTGADWEATG